MARIAVALLLSVLTAAVPGGAATAAFPGKNGFVLFNTVWPSALQWGETSSAATTSVVCGVDQAGHTARFTATDRGLLASPGAWSRDGKMLAYVKQVGTDRYSVVVTTLAGRVVRTIDDASSPSFAPDGSRLAFERPSKNEIAIASLADGAIRTLVKDASSPAWAPDGSSIAFSSREAGRVDIFAIKTDGSARRQVTTTSSQSLPPCILWGTSRGERIVGSRWDDVIIGLGGNDVLRGGAGADHDGGAGADRILGAGGDDYIDRGHDADVIDGGPGRDVIIGGY